MIRTTFAAAAATLTLATSLAAIFNCFLLYRFLRKKIGPLGISRILDSLLRILLAGLLMGLVCHFAVYRINVIVAVIIGIGVYFLTCFALGAREMKELLSWILKRR